MRASDVIAFDSVHLLPRLSWIAATGLTMVAAVYGQLDVSLAAWGAVVVAEFIFRPLARPAIGLVLSLTLYSSMAWIAFRYGGDVYAPWPSLTLVQDVTKQDLVATMAAAVALDLLFGFERLSDSVRAAARYLTSNAGRRSSAAYHLASFLLLAVGIVDAVRLLDLGVGTVLSAQRRAFSSNLILTSDHNVQVLVMACSAYVAVRLLRRSVGSIGWAPLVLCWLPYLVVGSRKEFVVVFVVVVTSLLGHISRRGWVLITIGGLAVFAAPGLAGRDLLLSMHEFILPQYMHFAFEMGLVPPEFAGSFVDRSQLLLPSFLRTSPMLDYGRAFFDLGIMPLGIGASPFGEAAITPVMSSFVGSFVTLYVSLAAIIHLAGRRLPRLAIVLYALMLLYGRSEFWVLVFFAIAISSVLYVLDLFGRANALEPQPLSASHRAGVAGV